METKYGKYIVTELKKNIVEAPWSPPSTPCEKGKGGRLLWLDDEVVPGAFYLECAWDLPNPEGTPKPPMEVQPHTHDYDEVLCFFGSNQEDYYDLGAEIEFWLDDEKHIITKSCIIFIPKGLPHGPLKIHRVDRPIFSFSSGYGKKYF